MDILERKDKFDSIKDDVLPYLVRTQLVIIFLVSVCLN
jgi:hypothetical protein